MPKSRIYIRITRLFEGSAEGPLAVLTLSVTIIILASLYVFAG